MADWEQEIYPKEKC